MSESDTQSNAAIWRQMTLVIGKAISQEHSLNAKRTG